MNAPVSSPTRRRAAERELSAIPVDAHGTPLRKLPDCPGCGHDELWAWRQSPSLHGFSCNLCSFSLRIEQLLESSESPASAFDRVVEAIANAANDAQLRSFALSVLVNRAGGQLVLTADELELGHGLPATVKVDAETGALTLTANPCPHCAADPRHRVGHA